MRRSSKPPRSVTPWPCVILALDPAKSSGWAIFVRGKLVLSGVATTAEQRRNVIDLVRKAAAVELGPDLAIVVVAEKWSAGGRGRKPGSKFSLGSLSGLGASFGAWSEQLELSGAAIRPLVRVLPRTWQARVFQVGRQPKRDRVNELAAMVAARLGRDDAPADEAHAICIGAWASDAGEVGKVLTLTYLERHGHDTRLRRALEQAAKDTKARKATAA